MPRKEYIKHVKRIVVKVGSSTVTTPVGLNRPGIRNLVSQLAHLVSKGYQVVLVTSGAISAGKAQLTVSKKTLTVPEKQALASVGQSLLMEEYRKQFRKLGINTGQILLTEDDIKNRRRFLNARNALNTLLAMKVVPIINENDSVVIKEIRFGDNDTLSAHVTSLIDAQLLVILSDIDGFYHDLEDQEPAEEIHEIDEAILQKAGRPGSEMGTGGMVTKIRAAEIVMRFGEMMIIAQGNRKDVLIDIMKGKKIGTLFTGNGKSLTSRKKWLSLTKTAGAIVIDSGAQTAVVTGNRSLLATGITAVHGNFYMGDSVEIQNEQGDVLAKGVVNYPSDILDAIKGKKTSEVKKIVQGGFFQEVVNRDDMIIL